MMDWMDAYKAYNFDNVPGIANAREWQEQREGTEEWGGLLRVLCHACMAGADWRLAGTAVPPPCPFCSQPTLGQA